MHTVVDAWLRKDEIPPILQLGSVLLLFYLTLLYLILSIPWIGDDLTPKSLFSVSLISDHVPVVELRIIPHHPWIKSIVV